MALTATRVGAILSRQLSGSSEPGSGPLRVDDGEGKPSRWNTLRALRVPDWWEG